LTLHCEVLPAFQPLFPGKICPLIIAPLHPFLLSNIVNIAQKEINFS